MGYPQEHYYLPQLMKNKPRRKEEILQDIFPSPTPSSKDLEETLKEKVSPLLEETMEKNWGITIPKLGLDITDQLKKPQLNIYIPLHSTFSKAKKKFKSEFLKRELKLHQGNISQLAKTLDVDRRSIHRTIKDLDINLGLVRSKIESKERYQETMIDQMIRSALEHYRDLIQPQQMEKIYEEVPSLSKSIAKFLPSQELTWKEAEQEFEKQFLQHSLEQNQWKVSATAQKVGIRAETLHRKIKKLGLRK